MILWKEIIIWIGTDFPILTELNCFGGHQNGFKKNKWNQLNINQTYVALVLGSGPNHLKQTRIPNSLRVFFSLAYIVMFKQVF